MKSTPANLCVIAHFIGRGACVYCRLLSVLLMQIIKFGGKLVVNPRCSSIEHHNFKRNKAIFLRFTVQSASSWGCCKIRLCFRPTESNSIHEIGRFRWEQSNKLRHCPRKLYTVLVKTPFSGVLTVTRTAFGAGGRT